MVQTAKRRFNMTFSSSISPLDDRYLKDIYPLNEIFGEYGLMERRVFVEIRYLKTFLNVTGKADLWDDNFNKISELFNHESFLEIKAIEKDTKHDVASVIEFIKRRVPESVKPYVHFALTSEDVNNLSHALQLRDGKEFLLKAFSSIIENIIEKAEASKSVIMIGRTHGEVATPTSMGKELAIHAVRLAKIYKEIQETPIEGKILGATGNLNAFVGTFPNVDWIETVETFVADLGFTPNIFTVQIMSGDTYAKLFDTIRRGLGILIDFDQDIWNYFMLGYLYQKADSKSIGSSTMPHKINPIKFENSEGNAQLAESLFIFLSTKLIKTRLQRDLTDSTVKRNMGLAFGHALLALKIANSCVSDLLVNSTRIQDELMANGQFFSELLQLMEREKGSSEGYDDVKKSLRGKRVSYDEMVTALLNLGISQQTIDTYLNGLTLELTEKAIIYCEQVLVSR